MCECYQIGGRFIAEDPDCYQHGIRSDRGRESMIDELLDFIESESDVNRLRELARKIAILARQQ